MRTVSSEEQNLRQQQQSQPQPENAAFKGHHQRPPSSSASEFCPSCREAFDCGKKRRLIDSCGHERCYTCMFSKELCSLCTIEGKGICVMYIICDGVQVSKLKVGFWVLLPEISKKKFVPSKNMMKKAFIHFFKKNLFCHTGNDFSKFLTWCALFWKLIKYGQKNLTIRNKLLVLFAGNPFINGILPKNQVFRYLPGITF